MIKYLSFALVIRLTYGTDFKNKIQMKKFIKFMQALCNEAAKVRTY